MHGATIQKNIKIAFRKESKAAECTYCYLVQNHLPSSLLPKNVKIKIHRILTLHVVLYGCETWTLTRREEHRLRVFDIGVLRMISGHKGNCNTEMKKTIL